MKKNKYLNKYMVPIHGYFYKDINILLSASRYQLQWTWTIDKCWYQNNVKLTSDKILKTIGDWFGVFHETPLKITHKEVRQCWENNLWGIKSDTERAIDRVLSKNENKTT